jgi:hypothetical protein
MGDPKCYVKSRNSGQKSISSINRSKKRMKASLGAALAGIAGLVLGVLLMLFCLLCMAGGHGTLWPAIVLFPVPMILARTLGHIDLLVVVAVVLAAVQFPTYVLGILACKKRGVRRAKLWWVIGHGIAVIAALAAA